MTTTPPSPPHPAEALLSIPEDAPPDPAPAPAETNSVAPPQRTVASTVVRSLLGLLSGLLVATIAGYHFGLKPKEVLRNLEGVPLWVVPACIASSFVVLAFQSLRWHRVMGPLLGLRYRDAYKAQIVGFFFNAILPARGGDLLRVQYLGRRTGRSRATILGTEIVDRWLDWWGWIPTFLVFVVVSNPPSWLFKALGVFGAMLISWGGAMVILTHRGWKPRDHSFLGRILGALRVGVAAFRQPRIWVTALAVAPLPWLWETTALTVAGRAFGVPLSLVQAFSVMIAFNLSMIVPSPGAIGTVEAGGTAALQFFHFDQNKALAFMLVYHFSQLLPGMAAGATVLVTEGERLFGPRRGGATAAGTSSLPA